MVFVSCFYGEYHCYRFFLCHTVLFRRQIIYFEENVKNSNNISKQDNNSFSEHIINVLEMIKSYYMASFNS